MPYPGTWVDISLENQILRALEGGLLGWLLSLAGHSVLTAAVSAAPAWSGVWGCCGPAGGSLRRSKGMVGLLYISVAPKLVEFLCSL